MKTHWNRLAFFVIISLLTSCISGTRPTSPDNTTPTPQEHTTQQTAAKTSNSAIHNSPCINVYLETSGSMNGYVDKGKSQFQQVVFDYLSNIKNCDQFSGMNLNYITDRITQKGDNVNSFINSLTSTGIMTASGNKTTTDIATLLQTILEKTDSENVSIFISDCIFSPGSVSNPEAYLENQKIAIRNAIKSYIDKNIFVGCTVYRIISDFKGSYFDYKNRAKKIEMQRPFYIWVFGSPSHIATIKSQVPDGQFMGANVENTWTIIKGDFSEYQELNNYGLLQPSPTNGNYSWKSKTTIENIRKLDNYFSFTFGIDMNLQILLYGKEYVTDLDNYYNLIDKNTGEKLLGAFRENKIKAAKYTHDLTVKSEKPFSKGDIQIVFDGKIPQWVFHYSDTDDSTLSDSNSLQTYGFKYMCEGIYAGFHANNTNNITARYNFKIK